MRDERITHDHGALQRQLAFTAGCELDACQQARFHLGCRQLLEHADKIARLVGQLGLLVQTAQRQRALLSRCGRHSGEAIARLLAAQLALQPLLQHGTLHGAALGGAIGRAGESQAQGRALGQGLGHARQIRRGAGRHLRRAGQAVELAEFIRAAAGEQREGRSQRLDEQVADDLQHDGEDAELRVVDRAADGQVDVDVAVAIGQQGQGQAHRQLGGVGAGHRTAQGELVEHDLVARLQLAAGVDAVGGVDAELAALDGEARVLAGVGRQRRELDVAGARGDVQRQRVGGRVHGAADVEQARAGDASAQVHRGHVARARGEAADGAGEVGQRGRVVGLDEVVCEVDAAAFEPRARDDEIDGQIARRCCCCTGRGGRACGRACGGSRRACRIGLQIAQVEAALLCDEQSRIEVAQRQLADLDARLATRREAHAQWFGAQAAPAQQLVGVACWVAGSVAGRAPCKARTQMQVGQQQLAIGIDSQAPRREADRRIAAPAELSAQQAQRQLRREVGLEGMHGHALERAVQAQ